MRSGRLTPGFVFAAALVAAAGAHAEEAPSVSPLDLPVESSVEMAVRGWNQTIYDAIASSEAWPQKPLAIAMRLLPGLDEVRFVDIRRESSMGESPTTATITVVTDGLLDDSVRGRWVRLDLKRSTQGNWTVTGARQATRCYRGCNKDRFSERPCP